MEKLTSQPVSQYIPDIIVTIELEAENFMNQHPKAAQPPVIVLSKSEYKAYRESVKEGYKPKFRLGNNEFTLRVRRIS